MAKNEVQLDVSTAIAAMQQLIQTNSSTISQTSTRANNFQLEGDGANMTFKGKFMLNQTINAVNQVTGNMSPSIISTMQTNVQNILNQAVDQAATAKTGAFATADSITTNVSKTKNALNVAISQVISQTNYQSLAQSVVDTNNGIIRFKNGTYVFDDSFIVDQKFFSNVIASTVMNAVLDATNSILASNQTDLKVTQKATSESKGILSFLENPWFITGSIVSSCVILIIVVLLFVVYSKEKKGGGSSS